MGRKKKFRLKRPKGKKKIFQSGPAPPWIELPRDVTANILQRLGAIEILESAQKVCTTWRSVCKDSSMWRVIDMRNLGDLHDMPYNLETMCRHAVDRSQGELIEINIEYFGTDELLLYIAERSSQLKCLRLSCCYNIAGEGLREAAQKLPQLEELHLIIMSSVLDCDIEAIGDLCPLLTSFTFNLVPYDCRPFEDEHYALAVAKKMPNLRHLRLLGNNLTNEGVQALLDSCPHLESLDLRRCLNVDLGGELGKRCSKQIKHLRWPHDSVADYGWSANVPGYDGFDDDFSFDNYDGYSIGDYDDYTNPFSSEYFPHHAHFYDQDYFEDYTNPFSSEYLPHNSDWFF